MANAFGIDISKWNIKDNVTPDWAKVKASCNFIAIRSGVSWGYTDPWFVHNWAGAQGMPRMAYHVIYFGEDATKQMDALFKIVQGDWKHDRLVLDLEVAADNTKSKITDTTAKCINLIEARTGKRPVLYSRASWVNQNMNVLAMPICDWWLAQYKYALPYPLYTPEATSPPALPTGVSDWLIHQTGEKYSGKEVGVSSYYVDSNRWNGDVHSVLDYFGYGEVEPDVPMSDSEKLDTLWAWYLEETNGR
jgi:lysozyme